MTRAELQWLIASARVACDTLLPPPSSEGPYDLVRQLHSLAACVSWVIKCVIPQGPPRL
jgi:hypothetical protein